MMIKVLSETDRDTLELFRIWAKSFVMTEGDRIYKDGYIYTMNRGQVSKCKDGSIEYLGSVK